MGYSCRVEAAYCRDHLLELIHNPQDPTNQWSYNGETFFFEIGRENRDGAITGSVWKFLSDGVHVRRAGTFRIEPNGYLTRFPHIPANVRKTLRELQAKGAFKPQNMIRFC